MQQFTLAVLSVLLVAVPLQGQADSRALRVISDRTPSHLAPLLEQFERGSGISVDAVFVDDALIARLQSRPTEADVVITSTADILAQERISGLLRQIPASALASVPAAFVGADRRYVVLSYRARALYVSRDRVASDAIARYSDLLDPRWRGRICIRSGHHRYNVSLFAQMAAHGGLAPTRTFLTTLRDQLARPPKGNDRNQVRGIYEGICDVAIANSYYMGIMLGRDDQRAWAEAVRVVFPDQAADGSYVMTSGAALTRAEGAAEHADELMRFLTGDYAQTYFANATYEYPVVDGITLPEVNRKLGAAQSEVVDGHFKPNVLPLDRVDAMRSEVVDVLREIDFDRE